MIRCKEVEKGTLPMGMFKGKACWIVDSFDGEDTHLNDIFKPILDSRIKNVLVKGSIDEMPEIKTVIEGCLSKGKTVLFHAPASSDIGPIRHLRGVSFLLICEPPKNGVSIRTMNFPLMQELDEVLFSISSKEDYEMCRDYITGKTVTRPVVTFYLKKNCKEVGEIVNLYLEDAEKFSFRSRLDSHAEVKLVRDKKKVVKEKNATPPETVSDLMQEIPTI